MTKFAFFGSESFFIRLLWGLSLLVWFLVSIWCLFTSNGDLLPRMGAFIIAAVALYYFQLSDLDPPPLGSAKKFAIVSNHLNMNSADINFAIKKVVLLAGLIERWMKDQKRVVPEAVFELSALAQHEKFDALEELDFEEMEQNSQLNADEEDKHRVDVLILRQKLQNFQAILLAIGTIQWGFGDLIGAN